MLDSGLGLTYYMKNLDKAAVLPALLFEYTA